MNIEILASQIKQKMDDSSELLKNNAIKANVYAALQAASCFALLQVLLEAPEKLTAEFTKALIEDFPRKSARFALIEPHLKPMREIPLILAPQELNDEVRIFEDCGCREIDDRMSLADFKKQLRQKLFSERSEVIGLI